MNRTEPLRPCPHCGAPMRAGSLKRHVPHCIKNPVAFARYCKVLASAPGSKRGVTCGRYVELSSADKTLPTVITLRRLAGCHKWDMVLAVFGLLPPSAEQQHSQCPHCGKFVGGGDMAAHLRKCSEVRPAPIVRKAPEPVPVLVQLPAHWLVRVQPGERTCLGCGDTFAPGAYCVRCGTSEDGTRRSKDEFPPSVATADYLRPEEYVTVR